MAGIRSFVAVELDAAARREMARVESVLRPAGADVKWVDPESMHLTLKFLGDVPPEKVEEVAGALKKAFEGRTTFGFTLSGVGAFPSPSDPRVVWVGVGAGREELTDLAGRTEEALAALGFPRERRAFSPHLTLGRCRSSRNAAALKAAMAGLRDYRGPSVTVRRAVLFSSDLRPPGPVYRPLAAFDFPDR